MDTSGIRNEKIVDIQYLVNSEECLLLEYIARLDNNSGSKVSYKGIDYSPDSRDYLENVILGKLFRKPSKTSTEKHLKNKYLYYLTGGAISYLEAIYSMEYEKSISQQTLQLKVLFEEKALPNYKQYDLVSLGSGDGKKDIRIIQELFNNIPNFNYYPIDISPSLLQLNINHFYNTIKANNPTANISPINADFFDFSKEKIADAIKQNFSDKPKIFMLLGLTLGNYKEDDLIKNIKCIMTDNDYLVIDFELYDNDNDLNEAVKKYFTSGNIEFLTNPFKIIPQLRGYLENKHKYFGLYSEKFISDSSKTMSIFENSKVYKPSLKIPTLNTDCVVAFTTRYKKGDLNDVNIKKHLGMTKILENMEKNNLIYILKKELEAKQSSRA